MMNGPNDCRAHYLSSPKKMMIIAGEPSGDLHGANLVKALKQRAPEIDITGIGGDAMARAGMDILFHIRDLSVMGVTEVLLKMRTIARVFRGIKGQLERFSPDLLILIDYPGFNLQIAAVAKAMGVPVLYYISPKVWAWKLSRLKKIKKHVDHVALIFPFEVPLYRKWKIPHTFVGHPLLDCHHPDTVSRIKSGDGNLIIGLLPGSRNSEIEALLEILLKSSLRIKQAMPSVRFLLSCATAVDMDRFNAILSPYNKKNLFQVIHGDVNTILTSAHLILAASGTVSLEAALFQVPTIIVYKMSWVTYSLARFFVRIRYVGLANIIAGEEIMPELLQGDATPEKISASALSLLAYPVRCTMENRLGMIPSLLGGEGASQRVATLALDMAKGASISKASR